MGSVIWQLSIKEQLVTGLCDGSVTPPVGPAPPGTTCGSGQIPRFSRIDGIELEGHDDATIPNISEQECVKFCADNKVFPTNINKKLPQMESHQQELHELPEEYVRSEIF